MDSFIWSVRISFVLRVSAWGPDSGWVLWCPRGSVTFVTGSHGLCGVFVWVWFLGYMAFATDINVLLIVDCGESTMGLVGLGACLAASIVSYRIVN